MKRTLVVFLLVNLILSACLSPSGNTTPAPPTAPPAETLPTEAPPAPTESRLIPTATPAPFTGLPILADASQTYGNAADIENFIAVQGGLSIVGLGYPGDDYIYQAWRDVTPGVGDVYLFGDGLIQVTRNAAGALDLDFTNFDAFVRGYHRDFLGTRHFYFSVIGMPRALSLRPDKDDAYMYYAPADYTEWYEVVYRAVLHIKNDLEMPGASYMVWNEPETYFYWRGRDRATGAETLDDYIEMYVNTWAAVKAADPDAKVGGPMTIAASKEHVKQYGETWGMEDFLAALARHNAAYPDLQVTLDEVVWQEYDYTGNLRLLTSAALVRDMLAENGFPPDTPQVVLGWTKQFDNDPMPCAEISRQQFAAYIASNIVEQFGPPESMRGVTRGYLYDFDYDGVCPNMSLVSAPVPERPGEWQFGGTYWVPGSPAITEYCRRPSYAVFEMLRRMSDAGGQFIRMEGAFDSLPPYMMATSNGQQVMAMLVNETDAERAFTLTFHNLPFAGNSIVGTLQLIDDIHSADCNGLENGSLSRLPVSDGIAEVTVQMRPYSVALITFVEEGGLL